MCRRQMSEAGDIELILDETGKEGEATEEKELDEEEDGEDRDDDDYFEMEEGEVEFTTAGLLDSEPPLSAVPPRVVQHDEGQMEVSTSPAFQCIDDVSIITTTRQGLQIHIMSRQTISVINNCVPFTSVNIFRKLLLIIFC